MRLQYGLYVQLLIGYSVVSNLRLMIENFNKVRAKPPWLLSKTLQFNLAWLVSTESLYAYPVTITDGKTSISA